MDKLLFNMLSNPRKTYCHPKSWFIVHFSKRYSKNATFSSNLTSKVPKKLCLRNYFEKFTINHDFGWQYVLWGVRKHVEWVSHLKQFDHILIDFGEEVEKKRFFLLQTFPGINAFSYGSVNFLFPSLNEIKIFLCKTIYTKSFRSIQLTKNPNSSRLLLQWKTSKRGTTVISHSIK